MQRRGKTPVRTNFSKTSGSFEKEGNGTSTSYIELDSGIQKHSSIVLTLRQCNSDIVRVVFKSD